ncbi:hypothetical protein D9619_010280 [Psilocybe cf. subviscida]|uniref:Methyltransferase type 11 domain-containing protein n=1 Tax=Psilocybe cf. subviscida TaxID=2480587 RepID=A0A8H5ASG5_9AGAR|nr:hypothetical protein D9619_010280 [Psilocybe cf. subviscida]
MATFAKSTFNAASYAASRPTYPVELFEYIFDYHKRGPAPRWERAVDVGCGTGQATVRLAPRFKECIGVDPSAGMLEKARASLKASQTNSNVGKSVMDFRVGGGEDLRGAIPEKGSVDLVVAAQAAHWFDWSKTWPEVSRVLRPGGTAAFWIYAEFRLTDFPSATPIIEDYMRPLGPGCDPARSIGAHFERPGRTILERYLVDVPEPPPETRLQALDRVYFCGDDIPPFVDATTVQTKGHIQPILMSKTMRWRDLLGYFHTFSALHTYHERYPADLESPPDTRFAELDGATKDAGSDEPSMEGGDIAIRFWKDLRQAALDASAGKAPVGPVHKVRVHWPVALILTRKSATPAA